MIKSNFCLQEFTAIMTRHSKLQKQILSLYKQFLQVTKDHPSFKEYVREEFRKNASLPKTDIIQIEYLLRRGWRQLVMLKTSSVSRTGVFEREAMKDKQPVPQTNVQAEKLH